MLLGWWSTKQWRLWCHNLQKTIYYMCMNSWKIYSFSAQIAYSSNDLLLYIAPILFMTFLIMWSKWLLKFSLLSSISPRYFVSLHSPILKTIRLHPTVISSCWSVQSNKRNSVFFSLSDNLLTLSHLNRLKIVISSIFMLINVLVLIIISTYTHTACVTAYESYTSPNNHTVRCRCELVSV
jgi:hypothetical protein